ncbi:hypothetical protein Tco_1111008 [Tanacetum coccineum]|uniref:Uncharacterized protein n=1 Tax=Tanacetum coccineum TaxID=301880 RepID=A0ABQ5ILV4_9ASTR
MVFMTSSDLPYSRQILTDTFPPLSAALYILRIDLHSVELCRTVKHSVGTDRPRLPISGCRTARVGCLKRLTQFPMEEHWSEILKKESFKKLEGSRICIVKASILYRVDGDDFYENCDELWFIVINNPFWKPWVEKGYVTVQDISNEERFDGYYHNQLLIKKSTFKSVMDSLSDYTQFTVEQSTMSNKLCYLDAHPGTESLSKKSKKKSKNKKRRMD